MSNEKKLPKLKDTLGGEYQLSRVLNRGGQGIIYTTEFKGTLIKGFTNRDETAKKRWREHIDWLIKQDIAELKLARPLILLEPSRTGYVMELMEGLESLTKLLERYVEASHACSEENPAAHIQNYIDEGGLARRVRILCQLARTLNQLHGKGMLYGDLSLDNIFVSNDAYHAETWLIDCDNISLESHTGFSVHTPDYGAPELVRGEAMLSSLTDCWSFAVVAYQLLTHNHPFKGDFVNDGEPEREESALRGELPWINDAEQDQNICSTNLPIELLKNSKLPTLFEQTFGIGKVEPVKRPTMAEWLEALSEIDERLVHCQHCKGHTLLPSEGNIEALRCFFCNEKLDDNIVFFDEFISINSEEEKNYSELTALTYPTGRRVYLQPNDNKELKRLMPSFSYDKRPSDNLELEYDEQYLYIKPVEPLFISRGENKSVFDKTIRLNLNKKGQSDEPYCIHLGKQEESHIFWQFKW